MTSFRSVYPEPFSNSKMVGIVGSDDAKIFTWFGNNPEYVHGINMMPFTPITEELLPVEYVQEEYPILKPRLNHTADQWFVRNIPPSLKFRGPCQIPNSLACILVPVQVQPVV